MNQDYDSRRKEPLPGAWRGKSGSGEYYGNDAGRYRDYDYVGVYDKKSGDTPNERSMGTGYDRFNGNQPVFPPYEERQVLAGGESRKRPLHDSGVGSMYSSKIPRSHESRSGITPNYRFSGDSSEILQEESRKCIAEMSQELAILDNSQIPEFQYLAHTRRLLNEEVSKVTTNTNPEWLDVESNKSSIKVLKRVLLPRTRPGTNVVGRLMGVKGSTLRKLCQTYKCHISICGAGSRKNPKEEAELLQSGEARYNHLACPLHAEVSTTGPPHLAYTRLGQILSLLHKIITVEERFEHDGLVFETSGTGPRRREDTNEESNYEAVNDQCGVEEDHRPSYRGRGRGRGSYNSGPDSGHFQPQQMEANSWRTESKTDVNEESVQNSSPKAIAGRGRGGSTRGRGGGFVPRARNHQ